MITVPSALVGLLLSWAAVLPYARPCAEASPQVPDDGLRQLYSSGVAYGTFLDAATRRRDEWLANTRQAEKLDPALLGRARAVGGTWHVLAVAIDSCSDSVSTLPWIASLVAEVEGVTLRVVDPEAGREVMEAYRTPDGRAATPTFLLLDDAFDEVGCFIERPPELQTWILESPELSAREMYEGKMAWYVEDSGQSTVEAMVEVLEAADRGESVCR